MHRQTSDSMLLCTLYNREFILDGRLTTRMKVYRNLFLKTQKLVNTVIAYIGELREQGVVLMTMNGRYNKNW